MISHNHGTQCGVTAGAAVARYHPATAILSVVTVHLGLLPKTSAMPTVKTIGGIGS